MKNNRALKLAQVHRSAVSALPGWLPVRKLIRVGVAGASLVLMSLGPWS